MIYLVLLFLLSVSIITIILFSYHYGISPSPSGIKVTKALLSEISPNFQGKICDLGSGFGNLAHALARHCPNAEVVGIEGSPLPYLLSKILFRRKNLKIHRGNFYKMDLSDYDVVVCYLYPGAMQQLVQKFKRELSGKTVYSHTFHLPSYVPVQTRDAGDLYHTLVYTYHI